MDSPLDSPGSAMLRILDLMDALRIMDAEMVKVACSENGYIFTFQNHLTGAGVNVPLSKEEAKEEWRGILDERYRLAAASYAATRQKS